MEKRKKHKKKIELMLWGISAGRCEKCGRLLYKHPYNDSIGNYSQIAHNLPVSNKGPRCKYKEIDSSIDIDDINNLLLLCYDCHKEIDEIHPDQYTPKVLKQIKKDFENFIIKTTERDKIIPTYVIEYGSNLHNKHIRINKIKEALFLEKYIVDKINLSLMNSSFYTNNAMYWKLEEENLENNYNEKIKPIIDNYELRKINFSIFAIAPIPLLVKLGTLLSNENEMDVYQLRKSPEYSWKWENDDSNTEYSVNYINKCENPNKIVLLLSISGVINYEKVKEVLSLENSIVVEVKTNEQPFDDFLRNRKQLDAFVKCYQLLKEELLNTYGRNIFIHLFAAIPVSIAVEIGRHWNETVDIPMLVYNFTDNKYEKAITIGGENE